MKFIKIFISFILSLSLIFTPSSSLYAQSDYTQIPSNSTDAQLTNDEEMVTDEIEDDEPLEQENVEVNETNDTLDLSNKEINEDINEVEKKTTNLEMSVSSAKNEFKQGDNDKIIAEYKEKLNRIGFKVTVTNHFDAEMEKTVEKFQEYYGLNVNGILNEATMEKIDEIVESPLQKGKRHQDTIQLKKDLAYLGFPVPGNGTNYFGSNTEKQVKAFQKYYNLVQNGIADPVTLEKIKELINGPLFNGIKREDVKILKQNLEKLGFKVPGNGTNYYGPKTEEKVEEFQKYYGLNVTGIADDQTINKIEEIINSPLQKGKRHQDTVQLKKDLAFLGFPVPGNGTNYYGDKTEQKIIEFQQKNNLVVNGIADPVTLEKIKELINAPLSKGMKREDVKTLKQNLEKLGFKVPGKGTNLFGEKTEQKVKEFQEYYGLDVTGVVDQDTIDKIEEILSSPLQNGKRHQDTIQLKKDLAFLGFPVPGNGTNFYGKNTEKQVRAFQAYYGLAVNGIADEVTLKKIEQVLKSPLQYGKNHKDTITLKENLERLGFGVPGSQKTSYYGSKTKAQVEAFQAHYNLAVSGIAEEVTLRKIDEILNSPLQRGKRHPKTIKLKDDLAKIGYPVPGSKGTDLYGEKTEEIVKQFQKDHNLPVSGIADEVTLAKIEELVKITDTKPKTITEYTDYNITLEQALDIQMQQLNLTDKYRNTNKYVHKNYLRYTGNAKITGTNVNIRSSASTSSSRVAQLKNGRTVNIVDYVDNGGLYNGSRTWYKIKFDNKEGYVHSSLVQGSRAIASTRVNIRTGRGTNYPIIGQLGTDKSEVVTILNHGTTWHQISATWIRPTRAELKKFLDPNNNDKFQHLRLDTSVNVSASELNKVLENKGTLNKQGQAFINASKKYRVNEAYLIAHALHETGNGSSQLAQGVEVGKDKNGNIVRVTSSNRKNLKEIKKTYNMFGIGAADSCPVTCGAIEAYKQGWFSPKEAIEGGAKWIVNDYFQNEHKQNTLYKMKWNPNMGEGYAWKQYATDIEWPTKQIKNIKKIYDQLDSPTYHFDIARYK